MASQKVDLLDAQTVYPTAGQKVGHSAVQMADHLADLSAALRVDRMAGWMNGHSVDLLVAQMVNTTAG